MQYRARQGHLIESAAPFIEQTLWIVPAAAIPLERRCRAGHRGGGPPASSAEVDQPSEQTPITTQSRNRPNRTFLALAQAGSC